MRKKTKTERRNPKLTKATVAHVASLANLKLTSQEKAKFQKQLSAILEYIALLNEVKTDKVESTSQVTGQENVFRKDLVEKGLIQDEALSGTKEKHQGRFKIKAIFE